MSYKIVLERGVVIESVAKALVLNEKDEVLVLTIGEYEAHPEKSYTPDLPGGQVEIGDGETERDGVIREIEEETGITVNVQDAFLAYTATDSYDNNTKSVSKFLYIVRLDHTPEVVISWEHSVYEWVPVAELLEAKTFRPFYKEAIEYAVARNLL
ncbi:MAG TPA: NUDIX hydrolase [Candidatus Microsaccharimonas sp.]|jgi:ADP-ribose pyrophosphatase YjhB (NUDIX family)